MRSRGTLWPRGLRRISPRPHTATLKAATRAQFSYVRRGPIVITSTLCNAHHVYIKSMEEESMSKGSYETNADLSSCTFLIPREGGYEDTAPRTGRAIDFTLSEAYPSISISSTRTSHSTRAAPNPVRRKPRVASFDASKQADRIPSIPQVTGGPQLAFSLVCFSSPSMMPSISQSSNYARRLPHRAKFCENLFPYLVSPSRSEDVSLGLS